MSAADDRRRVSRAGKGLVFAIAAASVAAGCSLFVDLDDLSDGGLATDPDAALDALAPNDAIAEADHASIVDAGDGAVGPFCPQAGASLCEDFDEADAASALDHFTSVLQGGGEPTLSTTHSTSAPRALAIATKSAGGSCAVGTPFSGTAITASFDLWIESRGSNLTAAWFDMDGNDIYFQPADETGSDLLEGYDPGDGGFVYAATNGDAIAVGHFAHVDFAVDFTKAMATVTVDGKVGVTRKLVGPAWKTASKGTVYFGCPATSNASLYYDDVVVR